MNDVRKQRQFFTQFGSKVGDTVDSVELVCMSADKITYDALNLRVQGGRTDIWGLLVFCKNSTYFYVMPYENYMTTLIRQMTHDDMPQEQLVDLRAVENFCVALPQKKWYSFLFFDAKHTLDASFTCNGTVHHLRMATKNSAGYIYKKWPPVMQAAI
ncbi:MAG: hypothetical protein IJR50_01930 [Treponema sp.]|nr:hypothetical protein [Treponema sp.]